MVRNWVAAIATRYMLSLARSSSRWRASDRNASAWRPWRKAPWASRGFFMVLVRLGTSTLAASSKYRHACA
jgi:hypothetical protein